VNSWTPPTDYDDSDFTINLGNAEGEASYEALEREQTIRKILEVCVNEGLSAELISTYILAYCRALETMAQMAGVSSDEKRICMESAAATAVAISCTRMIKSIESFVFTKRYRFTNEH
jgi:hypothetical protein